MLGIGPLELVVIFIVALIVIGPKRLPEVARALGKAIGELKKATSDIQSSFEVDLNPSKVKRASGHAAKPDPPENTPAPTETVRPPDTQQNADDAILPPPPDAEPRRERESHHHA